MTRQTSWVPALVVGVRLVAWRGLKRLVGEVGSIVLDVPFPRALTVPLTDQDVDLEEKAPSVWERDPAEFPHPAPVESAEAEDPWVERFTHFDDPDLAAACDQLEALVSAGSIRAAVDMIRTDWYRLLPGDYERVRSILQRIPTSDRNSEPLLLLAFAATSLPSRLRRPNAVFYYGQALRAARAKAKRGELQPIDELLLLVTEAAIYRIMRIGGRAESAALRAARFLRSAGRARLSEFAGAPSLYVQLGRSLLFNGDADGAVLILEDGLAIAQVTAPDLGYNCVSLLAGIAAMRGDLAGAREYVEIMRSAEISAVQREGYPAVYYLLAEAILALEDLDHEAAAEQMQRMKVDLRTIENWVEIARIEAAITLRREGPGAAVSQLTQAVQLHPAAAQLPHFRAALAPARAMLELAQGNVARAEVILRKDPSIQEDPEIRICLARVALARNAPADALQEIRGIDVMEASPRAEVKMATIQLAALLRVHGLAQEGSRQFKIQQRAAGRLGRIVQRTGLRYEFVLLAQRDLDAVRAALALHGFEELCARLPSESVLEDDSVLASLTEREMVVFTRLVAGKSIPEIAEEQFLSVHTIKVQARSVYKKLNVSSRDELYALADGLNLVQ